MYENSSKRGEEGKKVIGVKPEIGNRLDTGYWILDVWVGGKGVLGVSTHQHINTSSNQHINQ